MSNHEHSPRHHTGSTATNETVSEPSIYNENVRAYSEVDKGIQPEGMEGAPTPEEAAIRDALEKLPQLEGSIDSVVEQHMQYTSSVLENERMAAVEAERRFAMIDDSESIKAREAKIDKKAQKRQQKGNWSKKKQENYEWDMLGVKQQKKANEASKQHITTGVNEEYGVAPIVRPMERELSKDLHDLDNDIQHRQEIEARAQDPNTEPAIRAELIKEVNSWNGETLDEFIERRNAEVQAQHKERIIKNAETEQAVRFESVAEEITNRIDIAREAQTTKDPVKRRELLVKMSEWNESINDYKQRLLEDGEVDVFNEWVEQNAQQELNQETLKVEEQIEGYKKVLKKEEELRDNAARIHTRLTEIQDRITAETDSATKTKLSLEKQELEDEYQAIEKQHDKLLKQVNELGTADKYEQHLKRPLITKYLKKIQVIKV